MNFSGQPRISVEVHGDYWNLADQEARKRIVDDSVLYINPFDHPLIWNGHATLIDELKEKFDHEIPTLVKVFCELL